MKASLEEQFFKLKEDIKELHKPNITTRKFSSYAYEKFELETVVDILQNPQPSYFLHKSFVFASLCAWIVAPAEEELRKELIAVYARQVLGMTEYLCREPDYRIVGQLLKPGQAFYDDIYYPIGGLLKFSKISPEVQFFEQFKKSALEIHTAIELMRLFHFHARHLRKNRVYREASANIACPIVVGLRPLRNGYDPRNAGDADNTRKRWSTLKVSAAFAYAASSIEVPQLGNMLDAMIEGNCNWMRMEKCFQLLLRRASYAKSEILDHLPKSSNLILLPFLSTYERAEILEPVYSNDEITTIQSQFRFRTNTPKT